MKTSNQGFIDLHTPGGFFLIGTCFLLLTLIILVGGIFAKKVAAREKIERGKLKAEQDLKSKSED